MSEMMLQNIHVHRIELPLGRYRHEYEWPEHQIMAWVGGRDVYETIGRRLKPGEEFWLGNLNLIVVDYDPNSRSYDVTFMDGQGYQAYLRRRFQYVYDNIKARIILTAYIWGLADAPPHKRLQWSDIHWGRKK